MPTPPFNGFIWPGGAQPSNANAEIVRVTNVVTDTLTVTRGPQVGDPGGITRTIVVGDQFAAGITVKTITDLEAAITALSGPNTFSGIQTAPAFAASGLTGGTAASRYVGAVASGPPVSGTFLLGDFTIDQGGRVWVCTVAGSPGTWVSQGAQLGLAETTSNFSITTIGTTVTGLSVVVNVPVGANVYVEAELPEVQKDSTPGSVTATLQEDGTAIQIAVLTFAASAFAPMRTARVRSPSAGTHTYRLQSNTSVTGATSNTFTGIQIPFIRVTAC